MNVLSSGLSVSGGSSDAGSASRAGSGSKSSTGFEALLKDKPATQKTDTQPQATQKDSRPPRPSSARDETGAAESEETPPTVAATDSTKTDTVEPADEAPWPPLGLSALLAPAPEPAPAPPAVANQPATQQAAAALPVTGALAAATTAATATAAEPAEPAPLELPPALATATDDASSVKLDAIETPAPTNFGALLQNQALQDLRAAAPGSSVQAPTGTPDINSGDFDEAFSARVGWLADQKISHAHIRITPHDLGLVEVKLQLDGDRVHASFSSAHADVRQALESSLPRLREMLGEQGLQLAQADVGQQPSSQQQSGDGQTASAGGFGNGQESGVDMPPPANQTLRMRGLLDAYA